MLVWLRNNNNNKGSVDINKTVLGSIFFKKPQNLHRVSVEEAAQRCGRTAGQPRSAPGDRAAAPPWRAGAGAGGLMLMERDVFEIGEFEK